MLWPAMRNARVNASDSVVSSSISKIRTAYPLSLTFRYGKVP
jgi:hypothetical protein